MNEFLLYFSCSHVYLFFRFLSFAISSSHRGLLNTSLIPLFIVYVVLIVIRTQLMDRPLLFLLYPQNHPLWIWTLDRPCILFTILLLTVDLFSTKNQLVLLTNTKNLVTFIKALSTHFTFIPIPKIDHLSDLTRCFTFSVS